MGKISWAGPMTNIGLAIVSYALSEATGSSIFRLSASVNLIIALFNCMPVPPLDGVKIFSWNIGIWVGTIAAVGALLFLPNIIGLIYSLVITVIMVIALFIWVHMVLPVSQQRMTEYR
jgi:Zn-dependent protease